MCLENGCCTRAVLRCYPPHTVTQKCEKNGTAPTQSTTEAIQSITAADDNNFDTNKNTTHTAWSIVFVRVVRSNDFNAQQCKSTFTTPSRTTSNTYLLLFL